MKAIRRKTTGTGRMRYLKDLPRRYKNGFREGIPFMRLILQSVAASLSVFDSKVYAGCRGCVAVVLLAVAEEFSAFCSRHSGYTAWAVDLSCPSCSLHSSRCPLAGRRSMNCQGSRAAVERQHMAASSSSSKQGQLCLPLGVWLTTQ